jgi:hypothetical protein
MALKTGKLHVTHRLGRHAGKPMQQGFQRLQGSLARSVPKVMVNLSPLIYEQNPWH